MAAGAAAKAAPLDPEASEPELDEVEDGEPPLVVVGPEDPLAAGTEVVPVLVPETGIVEVPVFVAEAALQ